MKRPPSCRLFLGSHKVQIGPHGSQKGKDRHSVQGRQERPVVPCRWPPSPHPPTANRRAIAHALRRSNSCESGHQSPKERQRPTLATAKYSFSALIPCSCPPHLPISFLSSFRLCMNLSCMGLFSILDTRPITARDIVRPNSLVTSTYCAQISKN